MFSPCIPISPHAPIKLTFFPGQGYQIIKVCGFLSIPIYSYNDSFLTFYRFKRSQLEGYTNNFYNYAVKKVHELDMHGTKSNPTNRRLQYTSFYKQPIKRLSASVSQAFPLYLPGVLFDVMLFFGGSQGRSCLSTKSLCL